MQYNCLRVFDIRSFFFQTYCLNEPAVAYVMYAFDMCIFFVRLIAAGVENQI